MRNISLVAALIAAFFATPTPAQPYPTRALRIVVGFAPGGSADVLSRIMGERLAQALGQPVIIENRPAAGGTVATEIVAKAQPDGHTLLLGSVGTMVFAPALYPKLPYDVMRDFEHVGLWVTFPLALVVPASSPLTSIKALVEQAKAKPGTLRYASQGIGASAHIFAEMMNHMAKIKVVHVPYKGGAPALTGVLVGEVDYGMMAVATALTQANTGKIRVLGVTSAKPSAMLPNVPPIASAVPGYEALNWHGIEVPAKTPKAIVQKLYDESAKIARSAEMQQKLHTLSMEADLKPPEEYRAFVKEEIGRWAPIIKASAAKVE
ncbi:MAG TPA: tripartite tricarboxylate transporter substrate binding protein [Burkholderiales bacterium]|nr:tripartite tricarboxylate transporter substrate binding protein [Burkholderiales bacterium]